VAGKTLIVLRHAKSSWKYDDADFARPLSERGKRDAVAVGAILAGYPIDLAWCSSAARARMTWAQAQLGGANAKDLVTSEALYHAWPDEILAELNTLPEDLSTVLVVGHQPTMSGLVTMLAKPSALVDKVQDHYPTAGLAVLTYRGGWKTLDAGKATLKRFEKPRG